ncbi:F-box protein CPR1 [Linum perenne]
MANILLRLSVNDLVRCRRVSKQWHSIIDNTHFISLQLQRSISTNSNAALYLQDRKSPILFWKRRYASDINFFSTPIQYEPSEVLLMGSCHGLVCFSLFNHPHDFVVHNPSTGEWHTISISTNDERVDGKMIAYGFGYDELSEDYKVVRIIHTKDDSYSSYLAEINGVRSKGFSKTIPLPAADWVDSSCKSIGVFVGGSIHWCKLHKINPNPYEHVIHAIDLLSNTYHQLQFPDYNFGQTGLNFLNVGIVNTCLSLCGVLKKVQKIGIWVMEEYGNPESWNRLYCIDYEDFCYGVTSVGSNGDKILLMVDWDRFAWCDPMKDADDETIMAVDAYWWRVSKQWLSIIDDPHFISRQLQRSISTNSNAALFLQDRESPTLYWKQNYTSDVNFFSIQIHYEPSQVFLMGSCHGLVCFSLFDHPDDFVVFNPSTGERHTVSCPMVERRVGERLVAYGFGYDESLDDYKVVRILQTRADSYSFSYRAEINGVQSKGFSRTIPLPTGSWGDIGRKSIGVLVGVSIHWSTYHKINLNPVKHVIHAIDLLTNTHHQLQFPDYNFGETLFDSLNIGILDTRLSLCGVHMDGREIGIWVMEEYGNHESWNRLYCIDYHGYFPYAVISVGNNGDKIQLMIDWQKFAWCDPSMNEDGTILTDDVEWRHGIDLVRCRRVSKKWLSIIDDPHFISRQLQRSISTNCNAALYLQDRDSPILYWKQRYASDINFFSTPIMYEPSQVLLMGSCHGLVCFSLFNHPNDFVVLNPSTGERHKVIISANEERVDGEMVAYGFGYDEVSEDYKVVRIIQTIIDPVRPFYVAEINSVRSKCFSRTIPLPTAGWDDSSCKSIGVFVGGSIHWCKVHRINPNPHEYVIHSIDLLSNTYHQLQLPHYSFGEFRLDNLNVGIVDTSLSLCGALKNVQKIVIWVMEEYGNSESWKRLYYIDYGGCLPYPVFSVGSNGVKILLMLDWQKFAWCDPIKDADETILAVDADWRYGRRVSKRWLSIIDDPHFISRQLQRSISTNSNVALFLQDRESPTLYWKQNYTSDVNFFSIQIHYEPSQVFLMGSCHGLVCFSLFDHPDDFVVFNPSTGERHTISCPMVERRVGERLVAYGFGYDESSDDYKVIRILQTRADSYSFSYRAEINGVRSKGFSRTIPLPTGSWGDIGRKSIGVLVGVSIHWSTYHKINLYPVKHVIHAIDLLTNTYHQLQFPDSNFGETLFDSLNIGTVDTRLSLCGVHMDGRKIGIWVMEEYGNHESWNRLYYIDYHGYFPYAVISVGNNGDKIQLMIDWQKFAWCDPSMNEDGITLTDDVEWRHGILVSALMCDLSSRKDYMF